MTEQIKPFVRIDDTEPEGGTGAAEQDRWPRIMHWLRAHFWLVGAALFLAMLGVIGSLYGEFDNVTITGRLGLRFVRDIYAPEIQRKLLLAIMIGAGSLLCLHASALIAGRRRGAVVWSRGAALIAAAGLVPGVVLWRAAGRLTEYESMVAEVLADFPWAVRILAAMLIAQSVLALVYQIILSVPRVTRFHKDHTRGMPIMGRIARGLVVIGLLAALIAGVVLGVLTDWLYELPVAAAEPGEVIYATSFDGYADDWDRFQGRDWAEIRPSGEFGLLTENAEFPAVTGGALVITYGTPIAGGIAWSALDRVVGDFDLRVTAQQVSGPYDQNQFGVIFRYRDEGNFYVFRITSDGWYKLAKVTDGVEEIVSDWGQTDAIRVSAMGSGGEMVHRANVIRIVGKGDRFRFWVNGRALPLCLRGSNAVSMWSAPGQCFTSEPVDEYADSALAQGQIALAAGTLDGSAVTVVFDDLVIVGPD